MAVRAEPAAIPGAFSGTERRADFPVFERPTSTGDRLVYLDSAASAPKPRVVIEAMADAYSHHYANVHRGIYELSEDATGRFEAARRKVTDLPPRPERARDRLRPERNRGHQPGRLLVGPDEPGRRAT